MAVAVVVGITVGIAVTVVVTVTVAGVGTVRIGVTIGIVVVVVVVVGVAMSDHPIPDELVDHIARLGIPASERRPDALDRQRAWNMLQALAEWADGGLIDPSTWTVVEVTLGMNASPDHCDDCDGDGCSMCLPMFILTPREGER